MRIVFAFALMLAGLVLFFGALWRFSPALAVAAFGAGLARAATHIVKEEP